MLTKIPTSFRFSPLTPVKIQLAIPVVHVSIKVKPDIRFRPTDQSVLSYRTAVIFFVQDSTQSTNIPTFISMTNKQHMKAADLIHNTGKLLPGTLSTSIPAADGHIATYLHTIVHHGILPIIEHSIKAPHIKRIRIRPPVLRYIAIKQNFPHHNATRRIHIRFLLRRQSRCYSVLVVRGLVKNRKMVEADNPN